MMGKRFQLASLFSDHMIFQANKPVRLFGVCENNQSFHITFFDKNYFFKTKGETFVFELGTYDYVQIPFSFTIASEEEKITIQDCLIGEVFIASGQSNMQFIMKDCIEVPIQENPLIRFYEVAKLPFDNADKEFPYFYFSNEAWYACTKESTLNFSTIGYLVSNQLYSEMNVPIGIISCNMGDTSVFSWCEYNLLETKVELKEFMNQYRQEIAKYESLEKYTQKYNEKLPQLMNFYGEIEKGIREGLSAEKSHEDAYKAYPDPYIPMGPRHHNRPAGCFEMMVRKIIPFVSRGVFFYQGESNHQQVSIYQFGFQAMVESWRDAFKDKNLPFVFVQIAGYSYPGVEELTIAKLREEQEKCQNPANYIYMVTAADRGEKDNIHPKDKRDVSKRIADMVMERIFLKPMNAFSPRLKYAKKGVNQIVIAFQDNVSNLVTLSKKKLGIYVSKNHVDFEMCKSVLIEENRIILKDVQDIVEIRYAYTSYPLMDFYTINDLPVLPFRVLLDK